MPAYGSCILATAASTLVGVIRPLICLPATNGPSKSTPNQVPNCFESLIAFHTRSRGARSTTFFSILSVVDICNLQVAHSIPRLAATCNRLVAIILAANLTQRAGARSARRGEERRARLYGGRRLEDSPPQGSGAARSAATSATRAST